MQLNVAILDSGGWNLKYGLVQTRRDEETREKRSKNNNNDHDSANDGSSYLSMRNCTGRLKHQISIMVGDELSSVKNQGKLLFRRPLERGYCTDWGTQLEVWKRALLSHPERALFGAWKNNVSIVNKRRRKGKDGSAAELVVAVENPKPLISNACCFILTQPFTPSVILNGLDSVVFQDLQFGVCCRRLGACMAAFKYNNDKKKQRLSKNNEVHIDSIEKLHNSSVEDYSGCCLVIDSGFSVTHIVPTVDNFGIRKGIRRINVGGKLMTNYLKEMISYRQWNMMDEFVLINDAKEKLCYVSTSFDCELKSARGKRINDFDRNFVLPDFSNTFEGSVEIPQRLIQKMEQERIKLTEKSLDFNKESESHKNSTKVDISNGDDKEDEKENRNNIDSGESNSDDSDEETTEAQLKRIRAQKREEMRRRELEALERQILSLSVERFSTPEILFRPKDIGLDQAGLCDAIIQSVEACNPSLRGPLYRNILIVGGCANLPNIQDRVEKELRTLVDSKYAIRVHVPKDPVGYAWTGSRDFVQSKLNSEIASSCVDRTTWSMFGTKGCQSHWEAIEKQSIESTFGKDNNSEYVIM